MTLVEAIGPETEIGAGGSFPSTTLLASGNYVVAWHDSVGAAETLVQLFSSDGSRIGPAYSIAAATGYHALAPLQAGGFVVAYTTTAHAFAQIFGADGAPIGEGFALGAIDYYSESTFDIEGLSTGGFAASWRNEGEVIIGIFDAAGTRVTTIEADIGPGGTSPQISELADETLALTWHEHDRESPYVGGYADGYQVSAQLFSISGIALSPRLTVNESQVGTHGEPQIVALADGGYVVTWVSGGDEAGIWAQIYDETGTAIGANIYVSDLLPGYQSDPDIAALSWGGFLVSWADNSVGDQDRDSGIRAQLFDGRGARVGETIQVNAQHDADENQPAIVVVSDTEARIFYRAGGNADPSGLLERSIRLPIVGSYGADVLNGTAADDGLAGLDENDIINGADGNDSLDGGTGHDNLFGGAGDDTYLRVEAVDQIVELAGEGFDSVEATVSYVLPDHVEGLSLLGSPSPYDSPAAISGTGNSSDNLIIGNDGDNLLAGLAGSDTLVGGYGNDRLDGGEGSDTASYVAAVSVAVSLAIEGEQSTGTAGLDTLVSIENLVGSDGADHLTGNSASNVLQGRQGNDVLVGHAGNDRLDGGGSRDQMYGGIGNDIYGVDLATDEVIELAGEGIDTVEASIDYVVAANIENVELVGSDDLSASGNNAVNVVTGNAGANRLYGLGGDDLLYGGHGDDLLDGGAGDDLLNGNGGHDTSTYASSVASVTVNLAIVTAQHTGGAGTDTLIGIEALTGSRFADVLMGQHGVNSLAGGVGDDRLYGNAGNDTLDGGAGLDRMYGGTGNDIFIVRDGTDYTYENPSEGIDRVISSVSHILRANVEQLSLTGTANLYGRGNAEANVISGNSGANRLNGYDGNDRLFGGAGNDVLDGGTGDDGMRGDAGNDVYYVDSSGDVVVEALNGGTDTVYSSATLTLRANVERLTLTGTGDTKGTGNDIDNIVSGNAGANTLSGMGGNDRLYGNEGSDALIGGDGNDQLDGGAARDRLTGGSGADLFVFDDGDFGATTGAGADQVTDFSQAERDRIDLRAVDADGGVGGDQAFSFVGTAAFTGTAGELRYEQVGTSTVIQGDTDGNGTADFWIRLDGLHTLTGGDVLL